MAIENLWKLVNWDSTAYNMWEQYSLCLVFWIHYTDTFLWKRERHKLEVPYA